MILRELNQRDSTSGGRASSSRPSLQRSRIAQSLTPYLRGVLLVVFFVGVGCTRERTSTDTSVTHDNSTSPRRHRDAATSPRRTDDNATSPRRINPPNTEIPEYVVKPLGPGDHVTIDGNLDEPVWQSTESTRPFVHPGNGHPLPEGATLGGSARLRYDAEYLYVALIARDIDIRGGFDKHAIDPHLWTRDTVELMLDPEGDGDNQDYYEIQVNPQGLVFDSAFDDYNQPRVLPDGPFGHQEWRSEITVAVQLKGTLDDSTDRDEGYLVELRLPFRSLSKLKQRKIAPSVIWRANFYVMQDNGGVSWSPILGQGNFHKASRFGRLRFE